MRINRIGIIGAGGHAKVVIDALGSQEVPEILVFDQDSGKHATRILGINIVAPLPDWPELPPQLHVAIGDNTHRKVNAMALREQGCELVSVIHSTSAVSEFTRLGLGCFVAAKAILGPDVAVQDGVIVNHAAVLDHDVKVGAFSHIAPNATLGGEVVIGEQCLVGAGAVILPGVILGDNVIVGAGAVVTRDVQAGMVIKGVPAK